MVKGAVSVLILLAVFYVIWLTVVFLKRTKSPEKKTNVKPRNTRKR